jgi:hypothetical protein
MADAITALWLLAELAVVAWLLRRQPSPKT